MANISKKIFEQYRTEFKDEFGIDATDELIELHLKDLERKGCAIEYGPYCLCCPQNGKQCMLVNWEQRNPEFKGDDLEQKIRKLEKELIGS